MCSPTRAFLRWCSSVLIYIVPTCAGSVQPAALLAIRNSPTRPARLAVTGVSASRVVPTCALRLLGLLVSRSTWLRPRMLSCKTVYTLMLAAFTTLDFLARFRRLLGRIEIPFCSSPTLPALLPSQLRLFNLSFRLRSYIFLLPSSFNCLAIRLVPFCIGLRVSPNSFVPACAYSDQSAKLLVMYVSPTRSARLASTDVSLLCRFRRRRFVFSLY